MGGERHRDGLVDVEPFRVMIHFFSHQSDARHEAERGVEIREHEGPRNSVAALHRVPAGKAGQRRGTFITGEFCGHGRLLAAHWGASKLDDRFHETNHMRFGYFLSSCMDGPLSARAFLAFRRTGRVRSCIRPLRAVHRPLALREFADRSPIIPTRLMRDDEAECPIPVLTVCHHAMFALSDP